jgi:hypothetical protein
MARQLTRAAAYTTDTLGFEVFRKFILIGIRIKS